MIVLINIKKIIILKKIKRCFNLAYNVLNNRQYDYQEHHIFLYRIRRIFSEKNPSLSMSAIQFEMDKKGLFSKMRRRMSGLPPDFLKNENSFLVYPERFL